MNDKQNNWDEELPRLLFAMNTADAYSMGVSKFLLCHGYELGLAKTRAGLAVSSGGRFIPGFSRGFFRPEETISSSFFRKKVEETNLF